MSDVIARQLSLLNQHDKLLNDLYHSYAARWNLSDTAFWILYIAFVQGDGCTQKEICQAWSYTRQTVNTALKSLERRGCITLVPVPGNQKSKAIRFTEAGRQLAQRIIPPLLQAECSSFGQMSGQEREALVALSQKRAALLQQAVTDALAAAGVP